MVSALSTKEGKTVNSFSEKYVSACCPHLASTEIACVYEHIHATFKSLDLVHAEDVRTIARQLFPYVHEQSKSDHLRLQEACADLASTIDRLSKVEQSDTISQVRLSLMEATDILRGEVKR
tara:strand:- start:85 stop:447 length:363 start_codon:yes stop_codon:yes gene_type:complete